MFESSAAASSQLNVPPVYIGKEPSKHFDELECLTYANILVAVKHCPAVSSKLSIQYSRKPSGPRLLQKFGDI